MAVIKLGTIVTDIAGSVGGTTFRRIKGGHSIFNKQNRILKSSLLQNSALLSNAQLIRRWSTLSTFEQFSWNDAATMFQFPDRFGNLRYLTGRQLYVKINSQLAVVGQYMEFGSGLDSEVGTPVVESVVSSVGEGDTVVTMTENVVNNWICVAFRQIRTLGTPQPYRRYAVQHFEFVVSGDTFDFNSVLYGAYPEAQIGQHFEMHIYYLNGTGYMSSVSATQFTIEA